MLSRLVPLFINKTVSSGEIDRTSIWEMCLQYSEIRCNGINHVITRISTATVDFKTFEIPFVSSQQIGKIMQLAGFDSRFSGVKAIYSHADRGCIGSKRIRSF